MCEVTALFVREVFKKIAAIYPEAAVTSAASTGEAQIISNLHAPVRLAAVTGPVYFCTDSTTPTTTNTYRLDSGDFLEFYTQGYLALYSTSTAATRQIIVFRD